MAEQSWYHGESSQYDPDVLPSECWAIFSRHPTYHKFLGKLDHGFYASIGYSALVDFLKSKHQLVA